MSLWSTFNSLSIRGFGGGGVSATPGVPLEPFPTSAIQYLGPFVTPLGDGQYIVNSPGLHQPATPIQNKIALTSDFINYYKLPGTTTSNLYLGVFNIAYDNTPRKVGNYVYFWHGRSTSTINAQLIEYNTITKTTRFVAQYNGGSVSYDLFPWAYSPTAIRAYRASGVMIGGPVTSTNPINVSSFGLVTTTAIGSQPAVYRILWDDVTSKFIAIVNSLYYTSTDGLTWTVVNLGTSVGTVYCLYRSGSYIVALGTSAIGYTSNGTSWTITPYTFKFAASSQTNSSLVSVAHNEDKTLWAASGLGFTSLIENRFIGLAYSTDGLNWNEATYPSTVVPSGGIATYMTAVNWVGDKFVFIANAQSGTDPRFVFESPDGITWTSIV
jgi:hypothetical protein